MDLAPHFDAAAARFNLSPALIRAYALGESGGDPKAVGPLTRYGWRAQGAMQMAPATYAEMAKKHQLGADPLDPADNVTAGAAYLRQLMNEFGPEAETVALAWNAGPGYARDYLAGKKGMPEQTKQLFGRIQQNLSDPANIGVGRSAANIGVGRRMPAAALPPATAAAIRDPRNAYAAAGGGGVMPAGLLTNGPDGGAPAKPQQGGVMGLLNDADAMGGALTALAPLTGQTTQPVSMGQVLAALAGGVSTGQAAGAQKRRDALMENVALASFMGKQQEAAVAAQAAEAYAAKLAAAGRHDLAAAVRANPDIMKEVAGQQAKSAFPTALSPGDRYKTVGDSLVDVTTGQPVYQGGEGAAKAEKGRFDKEHTLRAGFDGLQPVKNFREVVPIYQSAIDALGRDNKAADLNIVYGLAKIMDPASVVRESEMDMAVKTGSPAESLIGLFNAVVGGSRLTDDQRKNLLAEAASRMQGHKSVYDQFAAGYRQMAGDYQLDPARIVTPLPELPTFGGAAPPPGGQGGPLLSSAQAAPAPQAAATAQRAMLNGRMISVKNGGWVFDDDGSPVGGGTGP